MQTRVVGIDLGGTNVRIGWVDGARVIGQLTEPVGQRRSPQAILQLIVELIERGRAEWGAPKAVGIGAPGIVEYQQGTIIRSPHYPEWVGFEVEKAFAERLHCPVVLENDANALAWGECEFGVGKSFRHFIMLTFGTGIGGGIIIDRQLFHGDVGFAGEVGHITIQEDGPPCPCGGRGCWELFASGVGLQRLIDTLDDPHRETFVRRIRKERSVVTPERVFQLAKDGDLFAGLLWRRFGYYVGVGIASLTNVLGINNYILGGGLMGAWELFHSEIRRGIKRHIYPDVADRIAIHRAALDDHSGLLGAAAFAQATLRHRKES